MCAPRRLTSGVRSSVRSSAAAARSVRGGAKSGTHPELGRGEISAPPRAQPGDDLVLGDQPLFARVLRDAPHQRAPVRVARVVIPDEHPAARAGRRGPSRRASRERRRRRRCGADRDAQHEVEARRRRTAAPFPTPPRARTPERARGGSRASPRRGRRRSSRSRPARAAPRARPVPQPTSSPVPRGQCSRTKRVALAQVVLDDMGGQRIVVERRRSSSKWELLMRSSRSTARAGGVRRGGCGADRRIS